MTFSSLLLISGPPLPPLLPYGMGEKQEKICWVCVLHVSNACVNRCPKGSERPQLSLTLLSPKNVTGLWTWTNNELISFQTQQRGLNSHLFSLSSLSSPYLKTSVSPSFFGRIVAFSWFFFERTLASCVRLCMRVIHCLWLMLAYKKSLICFVWWVSFWKVSKEMYLLMHKQGISWWNVTGIDVCCLLFIFAVEFHGLW